ncbi:MAG: hypothetical protein ACRERC_05670 [Candidatus Binatia bacterium]
MDDFRRWASRDQGTKGAAHTGAAGLRRAQVGALVVLAVAGLISAGSAADPPAAAPAKAAATTGTPAAGAAAAAQKPTPDKARRAVCERFIEVLAGKKKDAAVLQEAELQFIGRQAPELPTCGAVRQRSSELCDILDEGPKGNCVASLYVFEELRLRPKGRTFITDSVKAKEWREHPDLAAYVEPFFTALRDGDASKCAATGPLAFLCNAYISLDPAQCVATSLNIQGVDAAGRKEIEEDCRSTIEKNKGRARGLKELAKSGSPVEKERAKAALGEADACKPLMAASLEICIANSPSAGDAPDTPGTPGAAATPGTQAAPGAGTGR